MPATTLLDGKSVSVIDYRCDAGLHSTPFVEVHCRHSVSYVRYGSFACRTQGREFELIAGSTLVGRPGDEYLCSHEHVCGDACVSFQFSDEFVDTLNSHAAAWQSGGVPPVAELMVLGELASAVAAGTSQIGIDEVAVLFVKRRRTVMASIRQEFDVAATADQVWDAIRDIGAIHRRLAREFVTDTRLEGETRVVTFANGTVARELIVDVNDVSRRIAYAVIDGAPRHHHASMQVVPADATSCRVIWIADVLPAAIAPRIEGLMRAGAKAMQKTLENSTALVASADAL